MSIFFVLLVALGSAQAQAPKTFPFRAVHYDVTATLDPASQALTARARVDFQASEASRNVDVELHPNLQISALTSADGRTLPFRRDEQNPLLVHVTLAQPALANGKVTLNFAYSGPLSNEENSPVKGVRLASISSQGSYLLLPARWFPLTNYPANRYTAVFNLDVPQEFAVVGTGKTQAPGVSAAKAGAPARNLYTFRTERPAPAGTFVIGNLQLVPANAEGVSVSVYAPAAASASAKAYAADVARALSTFSDMFGPLPDHSFTLAQLPDGTLRDFAGPGLLLISQRAWDPKYGDRAVARLLAQQWWGNEVLPATPADVWLTDGLSRYSEAIYLEATTGKEAASRALNDFAVGALMYEDAAPIAQAQRLEPYSSAYRSVVLNKGAMVFQMLRAEVGDERFHALLQAFYTKFAGKSASIQDFETLAQEIAQAPAPVAAAARTSASPNTTAVKLGGPTPPPAAAEPAPASSRTAERPANLKPFFAQWLNSTGIPELKLEYIIYRTKNGFQISGKVKQDLETFHMPIEVKVDTEGNPEYKTIEVIGTESTFTIDTFGRPKAGGITLDPHNNILKASTNLRVHALIARGEEMAELGRYYDAVGQYQHALEIEKNNALAHFRMGEAFFYQKNYQAAASAFREATLGTPALNDKWVETWAHIYLGKIFDVSGSRERAVNEYSKARQTGDDTGGAQAEVEKLLAHPYQEPGAPPASKKS